jgi:phospholipid/cholesterol/gamma-HCH transport system ATP-binding protein
MSNGSAGSTDSPMTDAGPVSHEPAVEFRNVFMQFNGKEVLRDVSFKIEREEVVCILGRSGVGKSVTLKLIIGLLKAHSGTICIETEDITRANEDDLSRVRRKMGFLFQSAALFDSFTIFDNLALPMRRFNPDKSEEEIQSTVIHALRQVGLEDDKSKMPAELSGGMKKRAGLARALVMNPKILLVDEPSSGLDPITASEIDDLLLKFKQERHTTMVIVTHDIRGAKRVADKLAVIDDAALVAMGTAAELQSGENETVRKLLEP